MATGGFIKSCPVVLKNYDTRARHRFVSMMEASKFLDMAHGKLFYHVADQRFFLSKESGELLLVLNEGNEFPELDTEQIEVIRICLEARVRPNGAKEILDTGAVVRASQKLIYVIDTTSSVERVFAYETDVAKFLEIRDFNLRTLEGWTENRTATHGVFSVHESTYGAGSPQRRKPRPLISWVFDLAKWTEAETA